MSATDSIQSKYLSVYPANIGLRLDLAFAVGAYGPDADAILTKQKEFIRTFVQSFRYLIANGRVRIAIISYDNDAKVVKNFDQIYPADRIERLLGNIKLTREGARVDSAFYIAARDVFSKSDTVQRKMMLLFTDATSFHDQRGLRTSMESLSLQGVDVVAFGTGNKVRLASLVKMASSAADVIVADTSKTMMYYFYAFYRRLLQSTFFIKAFKI